MGMTPLVVDATGTAISWRLHDSACWARIHSAGGANTIVPALVQELAELVESCVAARVPVLVLEGNPARFCFGADLDGVAHGDSDAPSSEAAEPAGLYDLWLQFTSAPMVLVSHVEGRANAGGVGFVAASDLVVAGPNAQFSLSELLFGLFPAMVLPFLIRRVGWQQAEAMTLRAGTITVQRAAAIGLVDEYADNSGALTRRLVQRISRVPVKSLAAHKEYMRSLGPDLHAARQRAVEANLRMFRDPMTIQRITRFQMEGVSPWESQ